MKKSKRVEPHAKHTCFSSRFFSFRFVSFFYTYVGTLLKAETRADTRGQFFVFYFFVKWIIKKRKGKGEPLFASSNCTVRRTRYIFENVYRIYYGGTFETLRVISRCFCNFCDTSDYEHYQTRLLNDWFALREIYG